MFIFAYCAFVCLGLIHVEGNPVSPLGNLMEVANQTGFNTFVELLTEANLKHKFEGPGKYTIFAPTNEAFEKISKTALSQLKSDPASLEKFLLSHISQQEINDDGIVEKITLQSLNPEQELIITFAPDTAFVNGKEYKEAGIEASNGRLYPLINEVLYSVNDVSEEPPSPSLTQVFNTNGCKILAELITGANISGLLEPSGIYTIFAPKDEAFESLSSGELANMKANEILLKNLIKSHIVEGEFLSNNLEDGLIVESLSRGYSLKFLIDDVRQITVNNIPIILKDLIASNGVVHVISNILISSSKGVRSENSPVVLIDTKDSVTYVEHEVGSAVEVKSPEDSESAKNATSFYVAVNENDDLLPPTIGETSETNNERVNSLPNNSEDQSTNPRNDTETTENTLETNKTNPSFIDETLERNDSVDHQTTVSVECDVETTESTFETNKENIDADYTSIQSDSDNKLNSSNTEFSENKEQTSNNTPETRDKIEEDNLSEEIHGNENRNNTDEESILSIETSTKKLHGDSNLKEESPNKNPDEDSTTIVATETESLNPSESSTHQTGTTNPSIKKEK